MKTDLKEVLDSMIDGLVENHIDGWKNRYYCKSKKRCDLTINYDPSLEIEHVEDSLK